MIWLLFKLLEISSFFFYFIHCLNFILFYLQNLIFDKTFSFSENITIILGSSVPNTKIELKGTVTSLNYVLTNVLYVPPSHWNSQYAGMLGEMFQLSIEFDNHFF